MAVIWKHKTIRNSTVVVGSETYQIDGEGVLSPELSEPASTRLLGIPGYSCSRVPDAKPKEKPAPKKNPAAKKAAPKKKAAAKPKKK
jgi:hypothetical protein